MPTACGVSVTENVPSAATVAAGRATPFGSAGSVRVTVTVVPAGNAAVELSVPWTVSRRPGRPVAGAVSESVLAASAGFGMTFRVYGALLTLVSVTAKSVPEPGPQASPRAATEPPRV